MNIKLLICIEWPELLYGMIFVNNQRAIFSPLYDSFLLRGFVAWIINWRFFLVHKMKYFVCTS